MLEAKLTAFMSAATRTRFAPGQRDCLLWLADWLMELGHPDYVRAWRGSYSTAADMAKILSDAGGMIPLIEAAHGGALSRTDTPEVGDVGLARIATKQGYSDAGSIRCSLGWAVLTASGIWVSTRLAAHTVWSAKLRGH